MTDRIVVVTEQPQRVVVTQEQQVVVSEGGSPTTAIFQGSGTNGLVPDPVSGYTGTRVLREDGVWAEQTGGGGGAPITAEYVVLSADATLVNEQVLSGESGVVTVSGTAEVGLDASGVKTKYESNANTNALTDAEKANLITFVGTTEGFVPAPGAGSGVRVLQEDGSWVEPSGGETDHGALDGLTDDDHTQYLLASGARALSGDLDLGTNDITNVGSVDGRDVSVDGAKLDGIEAGATADQTPAEILAAITTVDGSGSGLDADLLDGIDSTGFATAAHSHSNFSQDTDGFVPGPTAGDIASDYVLQADGTWVAQSGGGGSSDHGALTGLGDDDHEQYLLVAGTRAMSGDLDMGANAITNVGNVDGRDVSADGAQLDTNTTKLSGIESGATADQTPAEIRAAVEAATDSNVFTDDDHTKLDGITAGANLYVHPDHTGDVTSTGDGATVIADEAVTNAKLSHMAADTIKGRANGAGTGDATDLTAAQVRTIINVEDGATADQTAGEIEAIVSHDNLQGVAAAEHIDWTQPGAGTIHTDNYVEGGPGTDTDAIHDNVPGEITALTAKSAPENADVVIIEDSGDSNNKKKVLLQDIVNMGAAFTPSSEWRFNTGTSGNPSSGRWQRDNATLGSVTEVYLHTETNLGGDATNFLDALSNGDALYIQQEDDSTRWERYNVTGDSTIASSVATIPVELDSNGPSQITNNNKRCAIILLFGGGIETNAIHDDIAGEIAAITDKPTPVSADHLLIEDSAASDAKKSITIGNLPFADTSHTHTLDDVTDSGTLAGKSSVATGDIDDEAVTYAKMQHVSGSNKLLGAAAAGDVGEIGLDSQFLTIFANSLTLQGNSIDTSQLADDAVTNAKIDAGAVDTTELAADAVDGTKIADDAVDSEHIADDAVENAHIAAGAVNTTELAAGAATVAKIDIDDELDAGAHTIGFSLTSNSSSSGTATIDWRDSNKQTITLSEDVTLTFTDPASDSASLILKVVQDTTAREITWPASVKWPSGQEPVISGASGAIDVLCFFHDGTDYYGSHLPNFS